MNLEILALVLIVTIYNLFVSIFKGKHLNTLNCGLIGFSGKGNFDLYKIKFLLLWNSIERGKDSTGMFTPQFGIHKKADCAGKFMVNQEDLLINPSNLLIAHVRAKTIGASIEKNAHPFKKEHITLAHNGTLTSYIALANKYEMKHNEYDVDSQIITHAIYKDTEHQKNAEFKSINLLTEYEGAAALLFHNEFTPDILYVFRDSERTLFRGYDDEGNMYISSIEDTLKALNLKNIASFVENTLYTIKNGEIITEEIYKTKRVLEKEAKEAKEKEEKLKKVNIFNSLNNLKTGVKTGLTDLICGAWLLVKTKTQVESKVNGYEPLKVEVGDWIFIEESEKLDNFKHTSLVKDSNGKLCYIYNYQLDTDNFIPLIGDYVVAQKSIVARQNNKQLWLEGDHIEVLNVDYENKTIEGKYDENKTYTLPFSLFRVFTKDEIKELEELYHNEESTNKKIDNLLKDIHNFNENEDNEDITNDQHFDKNQNEDEEVILIDYDIHTAILSEINKKLNDLEDQFNLNTENFDITPFINDIKSSIVNAMSDEYLEMVKKHKNKAEC